MFAERTTEPPVQKDVAGAVMLAVGKLFTVIVVPVEVAEQLLEFVTVTVYAPEAFAVYVAFVAFVIVPAAFDH